MIRLFIVLMLFSVPVVANHGGLWHEPKQETYTPPQGYSGQETDKALQRELERQLRRAREHRQLEQRKTEPYWSK